MAQERSFDIPAARLAIRRAMLERKHSFNTVAIRLVLEMARRTPKAGEKYLQSQLHRREIRALRSKRGRRNLVQEDTRALARHICKGLELLVMTYPFENKNQISVWRERIVEGFGAAAAALDADRLAQWKEWLLAKYRPNPDQIARRREEMANFQPEMFMRWHAHDTLHVSLWEGVDNLAARFRNAFDEIPPSALAIGPTVSDRPETFKRALDVCIAIAELVMLDGRADLEQFLFSLHGGLCAIKERDRGFDEPLLRARPRSPDMPREPENVQYTKAFSAMACEALIRLGLQRQNAASQVAGVLNRNQFLPPKLHSEKSVTARSILNWERRRTAGELPMMGITVIEFRDAFNLRDKGHPERAKREVLRVLTNYLDEVKNSTLEISTPS